MSVLLLCGGGEEIVTGTVTVSDWAGSVAGQSTPAQKLVLPSPPSPPPPRAASAQGDCWVLPAQCPDCRVTRGHQYWAARESPGLTFQASPGRMSMSEVDTETCSKPSSDQLLYCSPGKSQKKCSCENCHLTFSQHPTLTALIRNLFNSECVWYGIVNCAS